MNGVHVAVTEKGTIVNIGRQKSTQTWLLALTALVVALAALVVTTALSTIRLDLGASVEQLERMAGAACSASHIISSAIRPTPVSASTSACSR
jgi:hypothetical protein